MSMNDHELARQLETEANRIVTAMLRHPVLGPILQNDRHPSTEAADIACGPEALGRSGFPDR